MYENHESETAGQGAAPPNEPGGSGAHDPRDFTRNDPRDFAQRATVERKSPLVACLLSCMPGLGQVYVGYYQRGFVHIGVVASVIFLLNQREFSDLRPLLGVFIAFFWIYNMIDAARCATAVNRGAEAGMQPELPQLPAAISGGGGVFAGVIMVGLGILLLSHTILGFSMAWLAEWWPLFLIIFGLRMIFAARNRDKS